MFIEDYGWAISYNNKSSRENEDIQKWTSLDQIPDRIPRYVDQAISLWKHGSCIAQMFEGLLYVKNPSLGWSHAEHRYTIDNEDPKLTVLPALKIAGWGEPCF